MIKLFGFRSIEPEISSWEINEAIYNKLSTEVLNKIYSEGEIRFNSTVDDIAQLRTRAYKLITIFISLFSVLITLYFSDYLKLQVDERRALFLLYFINILMITYFIVQLAIIVFPNQIMLKGEEPGLMNYSGMASLKEEEQNETYLFNSIHAIQEKIEYNESIISNKNQRLESVIFLATFLFVFTLIFELAIKLF